MDIQKIIRPQVRHFEPYLPGKPIAEVAREFGLKKIVKLASNENAAGISPKAIAAAKSAVATMLRYPEGPATLLRRAIADKLKLSTNEVLIGAGSDELIELIGKTFFRSGDEIIVSEHAFIRYKMAADLMGIKTHSVPMKNFTHDLAAMAGKINRKTKAIFIANPNNPTGTYVSEAEVLRFLKDVEAIQKKLKLETTPPLLVFDEAYFEYARALSPDYPDMVQSFRKMKKLNIVVLRTFSKIHALAGLRVGYGAFRSEVAQAMDRVRPPFNVSNVAQAAAAAAIADDDHVMKSARLVKEGLNFLRWELDKLHLPYLPSVGNFLLLSVHPLKGQDVFKQLLQRGVIVRAMDEYKFPTHIRVTCGTPQENKFFIQQLREVVREV